MRLSNYIYLTLVFLTAAQAYAETPKCSPNLENLYVYHISDRQNPVMVNKAGWIRGVKGDFYATEECP